MWSVGYATSLGFVLYLTEGGTTKQKAAFANSPEGEALAKRVRDLLERNGLEDVALPVELEG